MKLKRKRTHHFSDLSTDTGPQTFANRVFGRVCLWSPESRFFSVQEWQTVNEAGPPVSYLLLIVDTLSHRECLIASVEGAKGSIQPEGFIGESLMYAVTYYGPFGITRSFESKFAYLENWQAIK